ncbi:MAG: GH39 family glycosyl hydrolase [Promethearchaeota archaeon]
MRITLEPSILVDKIRPFWQKVVGCGHAYLLTRKDLLEHVDHARKNLNFKYLRFHGILSDDVGLLQYWDPTDDFIDVDCMNFSNVDVIFDELHSMEMLPFVELSFMPSYLASGKINVFKYPSNITPPKSYAAWESLVYNLVKHWEERYGNEQLSRWYFEVWNEPDLGSFWSGTFDDYISLYKHACKGIKRVNSAFRVGGPATSGYKWITPFLKRCQDDGIPVDFVSFHTYPLNPVPRELLSGDEPSSWNSIPLVVNKVRQDMDGLGLGHLELHVTEWNSSSMPNDLKHDQPANAAFICSMVPEMANLVDSFSYWTVSDVFEEIGFPECAFHGGFGLINVQGIKKPSFHAFTLLNELWEDCCKITIEDGVKDFHSIGTVKDDEIRLLLSRWTSPKQARGDFAPQSLNLLIEIKKEGPFSGVELDFIMLEIDEEHVNVYKLWQKMGSPRNPSIQQVDDLDAISELETCTHVDEAFQDDEKFTLKMQMTSNSVKLIKIARVENIHD